MALSTAPAPDRRALHAATMAAERWRGHDTRTLRLADLTSAQSRLVRALVQAAREANTTPPDEIPQ
jgi:hypothetical protein